MFDRIPGQDHVKAMLGRALAGGRLAHAYLFHGAPGLGKASMAAALAAAANCTGGAAEAARGGCGRCASCRRVAAGAHPDVIWISPASASIRIDQVRALIREAHLRPYAGRRRVFILREADRLTEEAANSLLKTLEEPPADALLILITAFPDALLSTIRSRCQQIPFRPVDPDTVSEVLRAEGVGEAEAAALAVLSGGNPGLARALAGSPALAEGWRLSGEVLRLSCGPHLDPTALFALAQALAAFRLGEDWRVDALGAADLLAWTCRDQLAAALGGDRLLSPRISAPADRSPDRGNGQRAPAPLAPGCGGPAAPAGPRSAAQWLAASKAIDEAARMLRTTINNRLVFEVLLLKLHAILGGRYNESEL